VRRATLDELGRDPVGRYVAGEKFAHFCHAPTLWGVVLWGRPGADDALELGRSLVLELGQSIASHASIIDATRLAGGDAAAFEALERYVRRYWEELSQRVSMLALVRPGGVHGAIVAGAFDVVQAPYPVRVFDRLEDALEWLAPAHRLPESPSELARAVTEVHSDATGTTPLLAELRALLAANLGGPALAEAASRLGVSERTLQRRLSEASTNFQEEMASARVGAAQRLLTETDLPITAIALEVGCASVQHFSALFRSRLGESPSAWRRKRTGAR
jgi:AraC-like DNA-binding protein